MWFKVKEQLPPQKLRVMAKNPFHEAISWIDGVNELGRPRWFHDSWEHADDFVAEWRYLDEEV